MSRVLYSGTRNASSWAFRAWLALREADVAFQEHVVDIRVPQRFSNLAHIGTFSPPAAVPVLVDGDAVIFDSLAIMEYANDLGGGALLPRDALTRARARSFLAWQHAGLSGLCPRLSFESCFHPQKPVMTQDEQGQAARLYAALDGPLAGGGPYLFGALTLADLALVPSVLRMGIEAVDPSRWPRVAAWANRLLARASVREWMATARQLPPVVLRDDALADAGHARRP